MRYTKDTQKIDLTFVMSYRNQDEENPKTLNAPNRNQQN